MTKTLPFAILLLAVPTAAQISGSINRDAPTVSRSIQFKNNARLGLSYTAIHFGEGAWRSVLKNTDEHDGFNRRAARRPIGSVHTNAEVTASGRKIPAGKYDLFFTVSEQAGFILNLRNKDGQGEPIRWRMVMADKEAKSTRFSMNLEPGGKSGTCSIVIAFGNKSVTVPLEVGTVAAKKAKKVTK